MLRGRVLTVAAEELPTGKYTVSSFFGAVHLVATRAMPQNRSLGEYIAVANLLGKSIARLLQFLGAESAISERQISSSLALLVCQVNTKEMETRPLARAAVGFSACGGRQKKGHVINERKSNLPVLKSIIAKENPEHPGWRPGNCAEAEAFAHLEFMQQSLRKASQKPEAGCTGMRAGKAEFLSISLTLRLAEKSDNHISPMEGKPFCGYCSQLAKRLSRKGSCQILDMAFSGN